MIPETDLACGGGRIVGSARERRSHFVRLLHKPADKPESKVIEILKHVKAEESALKQEVITSIKHHHHHHHFDPSSIHLLDEGLSIIFS